MTWLIALMLFCAAAPIVAGIFLERRARPAVFSGWVKGGLFTTLLGFAGAMGGVLFLGVQEAMAQGASAAGHEISLGFALALIGIGLPTGLAAIAAAIALGTVGAAALAVLAEKPELFGRTLVYLGLAEGIAIYGLVMSILLLGKL